jgi:hypothetical protein
MSFSEWMELTTACISILWMLLAYTIFQLQAKTFQVQADTFKEQQKVTKMSIVKFLYDIRPDFVGKLDYGRTKNTDNELFHGYSLTLKGKNIAKNFKVKNESKFLDKYISENISGLFPFEEQIYIMCGEFNYKQQQEEINITIEYEDQVGTIYIQQLKGNWGYLLLDPPLMIKSPSI